MYVCTYVSKCVYLITIDKFVINAIFIIGTCSYLYKIAHLGDDDGEREFLSDFPLEEGETFFFTHRPLKNLVLVDEMESLSPIMACQVYFTFSAIISWSFFILY